MINLNKGIFGLFVIFSLCFSGITFAAEPLSIATAVKKALEYSPYIQGMTAGENVAREKIGEARAMKSPKISIGVSDSRLDSPMLAFGSKLNQGRIGPSDFDFSNLNDPGYVNNFQAGVQLSVPLYLGGMDKNAVAAAKKGVESAGQDTAKAREEVIFRTIETYLNVVLARESVKVAEKACEASLETVRNSQDALDAQRAVESDLLMARVHNSQNEETLLRMRNRHSLALDGMATIMGIPSAADFDFIMPFLTQECSACVEEPAKLHKRALNQRPDYLKLDKQVQAVSYVEKMSRGAVRPRVILGASAENNREDPARGGHGNSMVFARVDWNVGDGGEARHKASGAKWQQIQLKKMTAALSDQIHLEIRDAITNINNSLERIKVSKEAVEQGKESLRILRDRYNAELAIMGDVLRAETSLLDHQMNHLKALYDHSISKAKLKLALGELTLEHCEILRE